MSQAFSPLGLIGPLPGAAPQAGMSRAYGAVSGARLDLLLFGLEILRSPFAL